MLGSRWPAAVTPARSHERELPDDEGFRLVSATAGTKGVKRPMPLEAWCCALRAHPLAGSMSEQVGNDDVIVDGRGVDNSTASAPRVPCAVTALGKERVVDHGGGSGCSVAAGGSCLRSVLPRIIPKPRAPIDGLSTLGREHSVGTRLREIHPARTRSLIITPFGLVASAPIVARKTLTTRATGTPNTPGFALLLEHATYRCFSGIALSSGVLCNGTKRCVIPSSPNHLATTLMTPIPKFKLITCLVCWVHSCLGTCGISSVIAGRPRMKMSVRRPTNIGVPWEMNPGSPLSICCL